MREFASKAEADALGYNVTHQGRCAACSTLQDLTVYLSMNLTVPVRKCGMKGVLSKRWGFNCIKNLGFTD